MFIERGAPDRCLITKLIHSQIVKSFFLQNSYKGITQCLVSFSDS